MEIFKRITTCLAKNLPFVAYRKPNKEIISAFFQDNDVLHLIENYSEKGFVFAPFDDRSPAILIPADFSDFVEEEFTLSEKKVFKTTFYNDNASKVNHKILVGKGIEAIKNKEFKKVVLSREEIVNRGDFDVIKTFKKLLESYKNACVYVWFHPKVGLWMGATPETLIKINDNSFETMSLAGTQVYKKNEAVSWQTKEIGEQQLVTDYVLEKLKLVATSVLGAKAETIKAGHLLHLKTVIKGTFDNEPSRLINILHPTPAVCGFPKDKSKDFILNNEGYDRKFYTGFFGELNVPNSELFVNLRCMEVERENIIVYVGGGITKESDPEKEWSETVVKAKTIKNVL